MIIIRCAKCGKSLATATLPSAAELAPKIPAMYRPMLSMLKPEQVSGVLVNVMQTSCVECVPLPGA